MKKWILVIGCGLLISTLGISSIVTATRTVKKSTDKEFKGIPDDLNENELLFIRLDSAVVESEKPKVAEERTRWSIRKMHNKFVQQANKELLSTVSDYPFDYTVIRRHQLKEYAEEGSKYVLDFKPFTDAQKGIRHAGKEEIVKFPLYILDLTTNNRYILSYVSENFVYKYGGLIKKYLLKAVKSKYK